MKNMIFSIILGLFRLAMLCLCFLFIGVGVVLCKGLCTDGLPFFGVICLIACFLLGVGLLPFESINHEAILGVFMFVMWLPFLVLGVTGLVECVYKGIQSGNFEDFIISTLAGVLIFVFCTCGISVAGAGVNTIINLFKKINK